MTHAPLLALIAAMAGQAPAVPSPPAMSSTGPALPASEKASDELAIGRDDGDRMTVNVQVGGRGPYRFLVDTGSERTVISRQLASRLQLDAGEQATLHSVVGVNSVQTVYIPDLRVSSRTISVIDAPALEASHIGADGMLGIDSLQSERVTFDFKAKTMSIASAAKAAVRDDDGVIVVRAKSRKGRLVFTNASIDGQKVTVIVDTGSQVTLGNLALEKSLQRRRLWSVPDGVTIETVTGEKMVAKVASLDRLEVGGLNITQLAVAFADAHIFKQLDLEGRPALLLGMNAMRAFDRITIDFAAKKVRFKLPGTSMRDGYRLAELAR